MAEADVHVGEDTPEVAESYTKGYTRVPTQALRDEHGDSTSRPATPSTGTPPSEQGDIETLEALRLSDMEILAIARFLSFQDLARIVLAGREMADLLTAPSSAAEVERGDATTKIVVPIVEVKLQTMNILQRASAKQMEVLRIWSRGAFEEVKRVLRDEGSNAFASLEKFSAKGCAVSSFDAQIMAPLLSGSRKLSLVNFERNHMRDDVFKALAATGALHKCSFETLNLRFNMVSDGTAAAVAEVLKARHRSLATVNFKMNRITDTGAVELADAIKGNQVLRVLNLRRQHPGLTDVSAKAFAESLESNSSLQRLLLRRNRISDEGCEALADAIARRHARLSKCVEAESLQFELDLEENAIGVQGGLSLIRCLKTVGSSANMEILLYANDNLGRAELRQALTDAGEDPSDADDPRLRIESSKPEHAV